MVDESLNPSLYKNQAYLPAWFFHRVAESHCRVLATDDRAIILEAMDYLKMAFFHLTKTYGLIAAGFYLYDEEMRAKPEGRIIGSGISGFRLIYDSTFKEFLKDWHYAYHKSLLDCPWPELFESLGRLFSDEEYIELIDETGAKIRKDAMSAAVTIRNNIIAHRSRQLYSEELKSHYRQYFKAVVKTLRHLNCLDADKATLVSVLNLNQKDPEKSKLIALHGHEKSFKQLKLSGTKMKLKEVKNGELSVWHRRSSTLLSLEPLFSMIRPGLEGMIDPDIDEYLAYEAMGNRKLYFEGLRSKAVDPQRYKTWRKLIDESIAELRFSPRNLNLPILIAYTKEATEQEMINYYLNRKYFPDQYIERKSINNEIEEFMAGDKTLMVISGNSGQGKSALLARLADRYLLEQGEPGCEEEKENLTAVLLLNVGSRSSSQGLMIDLAKRLCLEEQGLNIQVFLQRVNSMIQTETRSIVRVLVLIDAINENSDPVGLWEEIQVLAGYAWTREKQCKYPWLKIIVAVKEASVDIIASQIANDSLFIRRPEVFFEGPFGARDQGWKRMLHPFDNEELKTAGKLFLGRELDLSTEGRIFEWLRNPFFLKLYRRLTTTGGKFAHSISSLLELYLEDLCDLNKTEPSFASAKKLQFLELITAYSLSSKNLDYPSEDAADFMATELEQARLQGINNYTSVISELRHEEVIILTAGGRFIQIKDQRIRELLLARLLKKEAESLDAYRFKAFAADELADLPDGLGAVVRYLSDRLAAENYPLLFKLWSLTAEQSGFWFGVWYGLIDAAIENDLSVELDCLVEKVLANNECVETLYNLFYRWIKNTFLCGEYLRADKLAKMVWYETIIKAGPEKEPWPLKFAFEKGRLFPYTIGIEEAKEIFSRCAEYTPAKWQTAFTTADVLTTVTAAKLRLGDLAQIEGRPETAKDNFASAMKVLQINNLGESEKPDLFDLRWKACQKMGDLYRQLLDLNAAGQYYLMMVTEVEKALEKKQGDRDLVFAKTMAELKLGTISEVLGDKKAAHSLYKKALASRLIMADKHPQVINLLHGYYYAKLLCTMVGSPIEQFSLDLEPLSAQIKPNLPAFVYPLLGQYYREARMNPEDPFAVRIFLAELLLYEAFTDFFRQDIDKDDWLSKVEELAKFDNDSGPADWLKVYYDAVRLRYR
jgi:predicted negative regulator of RcsB-dependent stress response